MTAPPEALPAGAGGPSNAPPAPAKLAPGALRQLPPALLGRVDAAAFVSLSPSALDRLTAAGGCPAPVKLGGRVAWCRAELAAWAQHGCPTRPSWSKLWPQIRDRKK